MENRRSDALVAMWWSDDPVRDWDRFQMEIERSRLRQMLTEDQEDEDERKRELEEEELWNE